jgi:hypothetical protein
MGAATVLALAGTYSDLPRAILLEDPPAMWMAEAAAGSLSREEWRARQRAWITGLKHKTRDELIAGQRAETPHWSEAELGPWADSKLSLSLNVLDSDPSEPIDWPAMLGADATTCVLTMSAPRSKHLKGLIARLRTIAYFEVHRYHQHWSKFFNPTANINPYIHHKFTDASPRSLV